MQGRCCRRFRGCLNPHLRHREECCHPGKQIQCTSLWPGDLHAIQFLQISFNLFRQGRHVDGPGKFAAVPCRGGFRGPQYSLHRRDGNSQSHGTFEVTSGLSRSPQRSDGTCNCDLTEGKILRGLGTSDEETKHGYVCDVCYYIVVLAAAVAKAAQAVCRS